MELNWVHAFNTLNALTKLSALFSSLCESRIRFLSDGKFHAIYSIFVFQFTREHPVNLKHIFHCDDDSEDEVDEPQRKVQRILVPDSPMLNDSAQCVPSGQMDTSPQRVPESPILSSHVQSDSMGHVPESVPESPVLFDGNSPQLLVPQSPLIPQQPEPGKCLFR